MRLVSAEFLKLQQAHRPRRAGAPDLTVVPALIMLVVTGGGDFDRGGMRSFADQFGVVAMLTVIPAASSSARRSARPT